MLCLYFDLSNPNSPKLKNVNKPAWIGLELVWSNFVRLSFLINFFLPKLVAIMQGGKSKWILFLKTRKDESFRKIVLLKWLTWHENIVVTTRHTRRTVFKAVLTKALLSQAYQGWELCPVSRCAVGTCICLLCRLQTTLISVAVLFTAISHSFRLSVSFGKLCPDLLVHPDTQHRPLGIAIVVGTQYKSKIEVKRDQCQVHYEYL